MRELSIKSNIADGMARDDGIEQLIEQLMDHPTLIRLPQLIRPLFAACGIALLVWLKAQPARLG